MLGGLGLGRLAEAALLAKNALGDGCVYGGWIVAEGGGGGGSEEVIGVNQEIE